MTRFELEPQTQEQDDSGPPADAIDDGPVDSIHQAEASPPPARETEPPAPQASAPAAQPFVYAIGQIDARYPSLGVEKEFAQVSAKLDTHHLTERQVLKKVITEPRNRYLARELCWLFLVEGLETYILTPRDPADFTLLIDAYREYPRGDELDLVIGTRGPIAPPEACNGVGVHIVAFDQLYSFDRESLVNAIEPPASLAATDEPQFRQAAAGAFEGMIKMADNAGATDEHRALNYLAVRYSPIYTAAAEAHSRNASLTGVEVRPSHLSGVRRIVDVIFSYTDRQTDVVDKYLARVDVADEYPFLVTKLSPYFER
jgi:cyclic patellamide precursor peptide PatG